MCCMNLDKNSYKLMIKTAKNVTMYVSQQIRDKSLSINCSGAENFSQFLPCIPTTTVMPFVKHSTHAAV